MSDIRVPEVRDLRAHLAEPTGDARAPGVVVLHEVYGLNADIRAHTDRLAAEGYLALAPDLYSGPGGRARCVVATLRSMAGGTGQAYDDIDAARQWLAGHPRSNGTVGVLGFCMGGGFALAMAPRGFAAAAPCYGTVPNDAETTLAGACPVVASYGADDRMLRNHAARLRTALEHLDVPHDVKEYPHASHSFLNRHSGIPSVLDRVMRTGYRPEAADDAWSRILAFFDEHLRRGTDGKDGG